ncbi:MAG: hypothetical protein V4609_15020 [Pseudomonadota bacterium]
MERFPALRLILNHARVFAALGALGVTALLLVLMYPALGNYCLISIPVLFPFGYVLVKSYAEMVQIVTEMVH